jgi:hypothetical protein
MTPEEIQQKIDFIIQSHASSAARMDRIEADFGEMREEHKVQKEKLDGLLLLAHQLLEIARTERDTRKAEIDAERQAREAELQAEREAREAERERRKELEGRVDGIEEMTKFLRELLEGNLRPPDKPPETEN